MMEMEKRWTLLSIDQIKRELQQQPVLLGLNAAGRPTSPFLSAKHKQMMFQ